MHRHFVAALLALLGGAIASPVPVHADDALGEQVAAFEQAINQLRTDEATALAAVVDLKTKRQTLEQQKLRFDRQEQAGTATIAELTKQKPDKENAAAQAQIAKSAAAEKLAAAERDHAAIKDKPEVPAEQKQAAETKVTEARQQLEAADKALAAPTAELLKLLEQTAVNTQSIATAEGEVKRLVGELEALQQSLTQQEVVATATTAKRLEQEHALQAALTAAGRWVSFAGEIAPIFQQRCVACHNARAAKGRLNLDSYATLKQGGESGPAFVAGVPGESLLCSVVVDGSMPQDAAPLTPEQITLLQRWVEFGGRLDAGVEATARLIQMMPRRPETTPPEHYPAPLPLTTVAFSPDGQLLATSGYHEVLLWNVADGTLLRRLRNIAESVYGLSFHPDGQRLAVAAGTPGETGDFKVFRVADGELLADLVRMDDAVLGVAFSPDGSKLACSAADRSIRLFDASTYQPLVSVEDHADWVVSIAWSADGAKLASASRDKTSKIFNAATGDALGTFNGHGEIVYDVAFSADGKQALTCGADKVVRVWNIEDSKEVRKLEGATGELLQLAFLPDGRVVTCGSDKKPRIHQSADGKLLHTLADHPDWVYAVDVHGASGLVATGCADGIVRLWKLDTGEPVREWRASP